MAAPNHPAERLINKSAIELIKIENMGLTLSAMKR